jgi:hypothetical protein
LNSTPCTFGIEVPPIHLNADPKTEPLKEA